jgi:hypothetical protein
MWIFNQTPKFILAVFFGDSLRILDFFGSEPFFLEFITLLLERVQRVFSTIFETIIFSCGGQTLYAIPFCSRDAAERGVKAVHMISSIASVAEQDFIFVFANVTNFADFSSTR